MGLIILLSYKIVPEKDDNNYETNINIQIKHMNRQNSINKHNKATLTTWKHLKQHILS